MQKQQTPYLCHIFICTNVRGNDPENPGCGIKGGGTLKALLKQAVKDRGWKGKVRVSTAGCMGLCGTGPNVVLYPQGIHFSAVTENDVPLIMDALHKMLPGTKKIWFPAKTFGWGWGPPVCWQGWVVLLIYILLLTATGFLVPPHKTLSGYLTGVYTLTAILIFICWLKGEKLHWRWGK
jgi:(2Fe-2S) ferredoxin